MRSLRVLRDRISQAFSVNFLFNWLGEFDSGPRFWSISEFRSNQNPEITHGFGNNFPTKILLSGLM
eukprot:2618810-Amphidinium_carterae.1